MCMPNMLGNFILFSFQRQAFFLKIVVLLAQLDRKTDAARTRLFIWIILDQIRVAYVCRRFSAEQVD